jgi:hypothetical protein
MQRAGAKVVERLQHLAHAGRAPVNPLAATTARRSRKKRREELEEFPFGARKCGNPLRDDRTAVVRRSFRERSSNVGPEIA